MTIYNSTNVLSQYRRKIKRQQLNIRNSKIAQLSIILRQRLHFFRKRLLQIWAWRFQRKSFSRWRPVRFLKPFNINGTFKVYRRVDFRLKRVLKNYLNWRFNSNLKINLIPKRLYLQNTSQNRNYLHSNWFFSDVGSTYLQLGLLRNHTVVKKHVFDYQINVNKFLLTDYFNKKHVNTIKSAILESSNIFNSIFLQPHPNTNYLYKYHPKLQRSLNYNLTNILLGR